MANAEEPQDLPASASAMPSEDSAKESVYVVFFHGMGQQRHYESMTMLVDALRKRVVGRPGAGYFDVQPHREKMALPDGSSEETACLQVDYGGGTDTSTRKAARAHVYEAY
jgi:hypothetical protein